VGALLLLLQRAESERRLLQLEAELLVDSDSDKANSNGNSKSTAAASSVGSGSGSGSGSKKADKKRRQKAARAAKAAQRAEEQASKLAQEQAAEEAKSVAKTCRKMVLRAADVAVSQAVARSAEQAVEREAVERAAARRAAAQAARATERAQAEVEAEAKAVVAATAVAAAAAAAEEKRQPPMRTVQDEPPEPPEPRSPALSAERSPWHSGERAAWGGIAMWTLNGSHPFIEDEDFEEEGSADASDQLSSRNTFLCELLSERSNVSTRNEGSANSPSLGSLRHAHPLGRSSSMLGSVDSESTSLSRTASLNPEQMRHSFGRERSARLLRRGSFSGADKVANSPSLGSPTPGVGLGRSRTQDDRLAADFPEQLEPGAARPRRGSAGTIAVQLRRTAGGQSTQVSLVLQELSVAPFAGVGAARKALLARAPALATAIVEAELTRQAEEHEYSLNVEMLDRREASLCKVASVRLALQAIWPRVRCPLYGSFANGFAVLESDIDMVICLPSVLGSIEEQESKAGILEMQSGVPRLKQVEEKLLSQQNSDGITYSDVSVVTNHAVPTLSFTAADAASTIKFDISFDSAIHMGREAAALVRECGAQVHIKPSRCVWIP